jgi:hypothetical protein
MKAVNLENYSEIANFECVRRKKFRTGYVQKDAKQELVTNYVVQDVLKTIQ